MILYLPYKLKVDDQNKIIIKYMQEWSISVEPAFKIITLSAAGL